MRNIWEVLRERELKLQAVKQELEELRLVAPLLDDELGRSGLPQPEEIVWKDATTGQTVKGWP